MRIDDTIETLARIRQSIDKWAPQASASPDALIADLNDLYVASADNRNFSQLFEYDDVGSPSITLIVSVESDFDLHRVMENLRMKLGILPPAGADEIGNAGIVWSHGRYDFVFDSNSRTLRISHRYSHEPADTKSVSSIARNIIGYALDYLGEVKVSTKKITGPSEAE